MFRIIYILLLFLLAGYHYYTSPADAPLQQQLVLFAVYTGLFLFIDRYVIVKIKFYKILTASILLALLLFIIFLLLQITGFKMELAIPEGSVRVIKNSLFIFILLMAVYISLNIAESATFFRKKEQESSGNIESYIVDTSAIIDGRLKGICEAGFLSESLIIPEFVVREMQLISDSSNHEKRKKGRRGLDILRKMKESDKLSINIPTVDYDFLKGVDNKLLHYARKNQCNIITTDYNLFKVAQVEGIKVLNINSIATVLKPNYNIGDKLKVNISKKGNNKNQGVGYMDDDTMVVIEEGEKYIGETKPVVVTSYVQSSSGKMVFCKLT
ncbi:MAG TPA: TRAM domain-containing protein [Spirochaetota bacterium]|nr:TRAM domain-containing protein [Spirochaetota bacterium]